MGCLSTPMTIGRGTDELDPPHKDKPIDTTPTFPLFTFEDFVEEEIELYSQIYHQVLLATNTNITRKNYKMAPWLRLLSERHHSLNRREAETRVLSNCTTAFNLSAGDTNLFTIWVKQHTHVPAIVVFPTRQRKLAIMHHLDSTQDKIWSHGT